MPEKPQKKIRRIDRIYFYFDYLSKVAAEGLQDTNYFFQRLLATIFSKIFIIITYFFISPFAGTKPLAVKILLGLPRIFLGLIFLTLLSLVALIVVLIGGALSGIFGFRNLVDYSLKEQIAAWFVLLLIFFALPFALSDFWNYKICMFLCFTVILVGFNFLYGQCGIISLGHAGFVMSGAFMTAFLYMGSFGFHLPFLLSTAIAALGCFVLGILMGLPSLRVKDYYLVIVTLAFMLAVPQVLTSKYLDTYSGVEMGGLSLDQQPVPHLFHWMHQSVWNYYFIAGPALLLIVFAYNILHHSQVGRAFRTIKCDVEVSMIMGIPVVKYKLLAFAMSALYASVAGSFIMYLDRFISADSYTTHDSIDYIVASVVGGPGSILGCFVGGLFLTFEKDLSSIMGHLLFRGNYLTRMFYGIFMILIVFVAPRGIAGEITRRLRSKFILKPKRGKYYISPPPDYDFLDMKGSPIKEQ